MSEIVILCTLLLFLLFVSELSLGPMFGDVRGYRFLRAHWRGFLLAGIQSLWYGITTHTVVRAARAIKYKQINCQTSVYFLLVNLLRGYYFYS